MATAACYIRRNTTYWQRARRALDRAGFVEKSAMIDGAKLHYAQGPNNGPALLLIHGQMKDWTTYMRVLPELAKHFQVYAVDCYGRSEERRVGRERRGRGRAGP